MTENTYAEIVDRVRRILLTSEGRKKIERRRDESARMAKGIRALKASGWILKAARRRVGSDLTVFTVRQEPLQQATNRLEVSVELRGNGVGLLLPPENDRGYPILKTKQPPPNEFEWGGREARAYIRDRANIKPSPERDLQGMVFKDLSSSPKRGFLKNLWPVRPANCLMEISTAVNRQGQIGTGNIDLLARTGRGRWPTFVACELKVGKTTPYSALTQAIQYSVALDVEVNGIAGEIAEADRSIYRTLFGSNSVAREPLRFGAMAIIPNGPGVEAETQRALDYLDATDVWLDVMLFEIDLGRFRPVYRWRNAG